LEIEPIALLMARLEAIIAMALAASLYAIPAVAGTSR